MGRMIWASRLSLLAVTLVATTHAGEPDSNAPQVKKPTVTGEVTFKDKPKFEIGTEVLIQVQDTSRAGARAIVLGQAVIKDPKTVPIPFKVEYDASRIKPRDRISLSVRITHKGKLLYINDTRIPVVNPPGQTKGVKAPVIAVKRAKP